MTECLSTFKSYSKFFLWKLFETYIAFIYIWYTTILINYDSRVYFSVIQWTFCQWFLNYADFSCLTIFILRTVVTSLSVIRRSFLTVRNNFVTLKKIGHTYSCTEVMMLGNVVDSDCYDGQMLLMLLQTWRVAMPSVVHRYSVAAYRMYLPGSLCAFLGGISRYCRRQIWGRYHWACLECYTHKCPGVPL